MDILLKQPDAIPVSLGWNCHVALYIQDLGDMERRRHERYVFDWFGSPMWSICELIDMDFEGMTDRTKIIPRRRYTDNFKEILSHTEYELRFLHEFKDDTKDPNMEDLDGYENTTQWLPYKWTWRFANGFSAEKVCAGGVVPTFDRHPHRLDRLD